MSGMQQTATSGTTASSQSTANSAQSGTSPGKTKIAVLGGGAAAVAAVWGITSSPDWQKRFDITVYQMGWRLGGKCASGRDPNNHYRNYEHGLHILGGFYHNALQMLRQCYKEWEVFPNHIPFDRAFTPQNRVHVTDLKNGQWDIISCPFPNNDKELGIGETELRPYEAARALLDWIIGRRDPDAGIAPAQMAAVESVAGLQPALAAIDKIMPRKDPVTMTEGEIKDLEKLLGLAITVLGTAIPAQHSGQQGGFDYWMMLQVGLVFAKGIIADRLWAHGFDHVNNESSIEWLRRHGASNAVIDCVYCRAGYDYAFAYEGGDGKYPEKATMAAGTGLRGTLRMILTYHKAVFVHMNGGMGEIIFAPLYQVLKDRGVKFKYFHRIDGLELDESKKSIARITGTVQAKVKDAAKGYEPLISYEGGGPKARQFWPLHPNYEQLDKPAMPAAHAEDVYESPWATALDNSAPFSLNRGDDFDMVVLGISVGALNTICADLAHKLPRWHQMLTTQQAIQTISSQFWLANTTDELGWSGGHTVLTCFAQPYATWADMHHLLELETAKNCSGLAYFCGTLPHSSNDFDATYPQRARQHLEKATTSWINENIGYLWPEAVTNPGDGLKQGLLVDQYVRANCLPSDGYVLSRPGTIHTRMRTDETGITNLRLAGDWTRNGGDTGSFENAVMSGLQCSRAICKYPKKIVGESDF
jgi:uncharacterized protein with NAD-binding domain and iron-sulfur cluster